MKKVLLLGVGLLLLAGCNSEVSPKPSTANFEEPLDTGQALEDFVGLWQITPIAPLGSTGEADFVRFRGDLSYTTYGAERTELWSGTFDLNPSASPMIWDHRQNEWATEDPGADILGIYEQDGDLIRVSVTQGHWVGDAWVGSPRAMHFEPSEGYSIIEFRRVE